MKTIVHPLLKRGCAIAAAAVLSACAGAGPVSTEYDFGPLPQTTSASALTSLAASAPAPASAPQSIIIADISGPAMLDTQRMYYRLLYADAQQPRPYAYNSWSGTPLQLLTQRLKARVAQAGVKVLSPTDAGAGIPILRIEVDDFAQHFDSASHSSGHISLRASVFRGHHLVDQRSFTRSSPANSADAGGGARALAEASDALAEDLLAWMAALPAPATAPVTAATAAPQ